MAKLKAVSLFSGSGGFDWGASSAGIEIIWANDIDKYAYSAYNSILPDVPYHIGDIRDFDTFPNADVLIGCYPCTGFSIAARRKWKGRDERDLMKVEGNFLFKEYLRALKQISPKYFFVENVSGMKSALQGWFFKEQLNGFKQLGYTPMPILLKASDFGAPQDRKRIFIIGIRNDIKKYYKYQIPKPSYGHGINLKPYRTLQDTIANMPIWPIGEFDDSPFHGHYLTRNRKKNWNETSFTIVAHSSHVPLHPAGEPMRKVGPDEWVLCGDFNRRLSWRECARIQGLPDNLNPTGSLKDKYRVVGNAVPPVFAESLIRPIVEFES